MKNRFKVWDNEKKEWVDAGIGQDIFCNNTGQLFFKHYEEIKELDLKRYFKVNITGLTDKNGNEIYEGDVLRGYFNIDDVENHIYLQLTEKEKKDCYKIFLVDSIHFGYSYPIPEILEIIGNRFENPELLEAVK